MITIAIDFDGTCVTHAYPEIGQDIGAIPVLKALTDKGCKLILHTMRSHTLYDERDLLQEAIDWFRDNDIPLYAVNENPTQKNWTSSPKIFAHYYIDDAAIGAYLVQVEGDRPYVDWEKVKNHFQQLGIL